MENVPVKGEAWDPYSAPFLGKPQLSAFVRRTESLMW